MVFWKLANYLGEKNKLTSLLHMLVKSLQYCPVLCDSMDHNLPGSSVHEILQARILVSVATPSSRASWQPRDLTPALAGKFFTTITTWEAPFLHCC